MKEKSHSLAASGFIARLLLRWAVAHRAINTIFLMKAVAQVIWFHHNSEIRLIVLLKGA